STMPRAAATKTASKEAAHPSFVDMIKEAIVASKERTGISRSYVKQYIESNYKLPITPTVTSNINRALKSGEDKKIFVFPKGPSGKVKLAPKAPKTEDAPAKPAVKKAAATKSSTKENATVAPKKKAAPAKTATTKKASKEVSLIPLCCSCCPFVDCVT
ncbi:winged helix DNA-binding domain-containing protein, partial [Clavulina sp. PMI_390]